MTPGNTKDDSTSADGKAAARADNAASSSAEWLDGGSIERLIEDTSVDLFPRMVGIFVNELGEQVETLETAAARSDIALLERESHVMKSSAAIFGLRRVRESAERLNIACRSDEPESALPLVPVLVGEISPSIVALRERAGLTDDGAN
jgi:HPt (histidine-containing phosphotransfer) domain-containing protein